MILEWAEQLRRKEVSSVELTRACLDRIERLNPKLNAFITVLGEPALARASAMDAELSHRIDRGPFHGIPIAVKDLFFTRGVRTTAGSKIFADFIPARDSTVVSRLEQGGAILLGKTGLHELAYGITSNNPHFGPVRNPHDPERIPGGSSGGSAAAIPIEMAAMAMGTDTGGSIRIPASFCGCVGLKPTYGRVSKHGVFPLGFSLDHMGPLTATVRDAAITLRVIAGYDPLDPTTSRLPLANYDPAGAEVRGLRIGRPDRFYFARLDPEVQAAVDGSLKAAEHAGAKVVPVSLPDIDALNAVARVLLLAEASAALAPHLEKRDQFGPDVLALLDQGRLLPATDYVQAQRLRSVFLRDFAKVWEQVDCLVTPTTPTAAPKIGETTMAVGDVIEDVRLATTRLVRGINALGYPALSVPCGRTSAGLPIGMQIIAPPFREDTTLRLGEWCQV